MTTRALLATVAVIAAAACGGSDDGASSDTAEVASEAATTTTAPAPTTDEAVSTEETTPEGSDELAWPEPVAYHEAVYDTADDSILVVGGCSGPECTSTDEVWSLDPDGWTWTQLDPLPDASIEGALVYDVESDRVISLGTVFGSISSDPVGTWTYDRTADTWASMDPDPQPRLGVGARMIYDAQSDLVVAFGGVGFEAGELEYTPGTWSYDVDTNTWTDMAPAVEPPGINFYAFTYDEQADLAVLYGERMGGVTLLWTYDVDTNTWEELDRTGAPSASAYLRGIYDVDAGRHVYFGGASPDVPGEPATGEAWSFDLTSQRWTDLGSPDPPGPLGWHTFTYVPTTGHAVAFGGGTDRDDYTGNRLFDAVPATNTWDEIPAP